MVCFSEPALEDVMTDPVTQALMTADRVDRAEVEKMFSAIARTASIGTRSDPSRQGWTRMRFCP